MYVFKLQAKLITEPNPYRSTNTGLSVEPPNKDTRKGQDEINIMIVNDYILYQFLLLYNFLRMNEDIFLTYQ